MLFGPLGTDMLVVTAKFFFRVSFNSVDSVSTLSFQSTHQRKGEWGNSGRFFSFRSLSLFMLLSSNVIMGA